MSMTTSMDTLLEHIFTILREAYPESRILRFIIIAIIVFFIGLIIYHIATA